MEHEKVMLMATAGLKREAFARDHPVHKTVGFKREAVFGLEII